MTEFEFHLPVDSSHGFVPGHYIEFPREGRMFVVLEVWPGGLTLREVTRGRRLWQRVRRLLNRLRPLT